MALTHAQARRLVERLDLIGPCHGTIPGDFDRVQAAFQEEPLLVPALNALDPGQMEETPQGAAAHLGCREILSHMLFVGVKLDLFMACALGRSDAVSRFLRRERPLANARGAHGIHVLNHAADCRIVRLLLEAGADPNTVVYAPWGWTPVHEAAYRGRREMLKLMVTVGAKLDGERVGVTPLHAAARMGHRPVVEWLLSQGIDRRARARCGPWQGKTALALAFENGHEEIAALLDEPGGAR
jgi:hypothetical protein